MQEVLLKYFPKLELFPELKEELLAKCQIQTFEKDTVLLKQGTHIKILPIVISGLVKVLKQENTYGNEVLLYYIEPGESCVMSMASLMKREPCDIKAIVDRDAELLMIPASVALKLSKYYPEWNSFIYDLFDSKFDELLHMIEVLTFSNKDIRLYEYLKKESELKNTHILNTTHQKIASELGSSREVISRLLKKLEVQKFVKLGQGVVEILQ